MAAPFVRKPFLARAIVSLCQQWRCRLCLLAQLHQEKRNARPFSPCGRRWSAEPTADECFAFALGWRVVARSATALSLSG